MILKRLAAGLSDTIDQQPEPLLTPRVAICRRACLPSPWPRATALVEVLKEDNAQQQAKISHQSADYQKLVAEMTQLTDECLADERRLKDEVARARAEREKGVQAAQAEVRREAMRKRK